MRLNLAILFLSLANVALCLFQQDDEVEKMTIEDVKLPTHVIESGGGCFVDPAIYTAFEEAQDPMKKLTVIVTFKSKPDLLKHARDADFLMDYFQKEFLPRLEEIRLGNKKFSDWLHKNQQFFSKAKKNTVNVKSFKKSYLGNVVKGYYVYQTMKKASQLVEVRRLGF